MGWGELNVLLVKVQRAGGRGWLGGLLGKVPGPGGLCMCDMCVMCVMCVMCDMLTCWCDMYITITSYTTHENDELC